MADLQLSERVNRIKPSPTLAVNSKAAELKAQGKDIISLSVGEPDFDTPEHIKQAAIAAIEAGKTKYTAVGGTPSLKQAIVEKFERENNLSYSAEQILVSTGGKQSIFNLALALLNHGDEVIIPAPYWVSYPDIALVAGAKPVFIETDVAQNFKVTPEQLEAAITPKTRLFMINSPSNPSGMAYTREELAALGEVLVRHPQVFIATDDMYEHILWTETPFVNILNTTPELYERTVVLNGVSKAYSMTGWRIGYCAGPAKLIGAMAKVQSQSTSNPSSIGQEAAEAALRGGNECVEEMLKAFKERHDFVVAALNALPGVTCLEGDGTFYAFADFNQAITDLGLNDDLELAERFLEAGVAIVPGSAFGTPGCMRLSFAVSLDTLKEAVARIGSALGKK